MKGKTVHWKCDNWAASMIVNFGSMKEDCHQVAERIVALVKRFEITLETFWLSRESTQIELCDALSKDFDTSDYALSREDFEFLNGQFGPFSVDYFASTKTTIKQENFVRI